jgi:hypothetical protein
MRTTLTVDDDLAAELHRRARETGRAFKDVVNEALRAGLAPASGPRIDVHYPTASLNLRVGLDLVHARHVAAELEDDEIVHKLELRK